MPYLNIPLLILVPVLALCAWFVVAALARPRHLRRGAVCGACRYEIATPNNTRCSECGADLLKVGIVTSRHWVRSRGNIVTALLAWTILCALGACFARDRIAWRLLQSPSLGQYMSWDSDWRAEPARRLHDELEVWGLQRDTTDEDPMRGDYSPRGSSDYELELVRSVEGYQRGPIVRGSLRILVRAGPGSRNTATAVIDARTRAVRRASGWSASFGGMAPTLFSRQDLEAMFAGVRLNPDDPLLAKEVDAAWATIDQSLIDTRSDTALPSPLFFGVGGGGGGGSGMALPLRLGSIEGHAALDWLVFAPAAFLYALGAVAIVVRRRALVRQS